MTIRIASLVLSLLAHGTALFYFGGSVMPDALTLPASGEALRMKLVRAGEGHSAPPTPASLPGGPVSGVGGEPEQEAVKDESRSVRGEASAGATVEGQGGAQGRKSEGSLAEEARVLALKERKESALSILESASRQVGTAPRKAKARAEPRHRPPPPKQPLPRTRTEPDPAPKVATSVPVDPSPGSEPAADASPVPSPASRNLLEIEREYTGALLAAIERHKRYPLRARRRGEQGVVTVLFTLQRDGTISEVRVGAGSSSSSLDRAASGAVTALGRFEPIPPQLGRERWELKVPIRFVLQ